MDGDDIATCIGIFSVITQKTFVFHFVFMDELLTALTPADAIFQSREMSYHRAMPVVEIAKGTIANYRTQENFEQFMNAANQLISESVDVIEQASSSRPIRNRRRSTRLGDFVVEESIGERSDEIDQITSSYNEVIDVALAEFDARFTENNDILLALSHSPNMELDQLKPLEKLGITLPPEYVLKAAKKYIELKRKEWTESSEKNKSQFNVLALLYEMRVAFPEVYKLFAIVETFACSTAVCEASFSALAQIDIASRLSMTNERMRNLAFIAFEHKRLNNISIDDIMKAFNNKKGRRVQLY